MNEHFFKTLKIENFRGIKSLEIDDLARVNLFVGENNCGKTTVLEAAFMLAGVENPNWMIWLNNTRGVAVTEDSDIRNFFHSRNHERSVALSCEQDTGGRNLKISPLYGNLFATQTTNTPSNNPNGNIKHTPSLNVEASASGQSLVGLEYKFTVADSITGQGKKHQAKIYWTEPGNPRFTADLDSGYKEAIKHFYCWKVGYNHEFVDQMLNKKQKDVLLRILKSIDSKIQDVRTGSRGMVYVDIGLDSFIPVNLLGGGITRTLNILSVVNWATDGVVMVDEVEDGLHVGVLEKMWELILTHSAQSNTQIFLTTHSGDAIRSLRHVLGGNLFSDSTACYRLVKFPDDVVRAYRYSEEQLGMALDSDADIRL